jgi:hypothetical protein
MKKTTSAFFAIFGIWSIFCSYVTFAEQSKLYSESYEQAAVEFKAKCKSEGNKIAYIDGFLFSRCFCESQSGERMSLKFDSPVSFAGVTIALMKNMTFGLVDKDYYQALLNQDLT